jgi:predicted ATPase
MIHLRAITLRRTGFREEGFPFTVPIIRSLESLEFTADVTVLVGENGTGKSTFLEALACAVGSITVGEQSVERDPTLEPVRRLGKALKLTWSKRTRRGFFMRSEDFFGYVKRIARTRADLQRELERVEREYADASPTAQLHARSAFAGELGALDDSYGDGLDAQSHGESYLKLFRARFIPNGLYLLDEPDAPLSPIRQLSMLAILKQMVGEGGQFIIATHSPILMAYPGAALLSCEDGAIRPVDFDDVEHVFVMRSFLNDPERWIRRVMEDEA